MEKWPILGLGQEIHRWAWRILCTRKWGSAQTKTPCLRHVTGKGANWNSSPRWGGVLSRRTAPLPAFHAVLFGRKSLCVAQPMEWEVTFHLLAAAAKLLQSCLTLCDPMDCCLPGSSVHGIFPGKSTRVGCRGLLHHLLEEGYLHKCITHIKTYWNSPLLFVHVC